MGEVKESREPGSFKRFLNATPDTYGTFCCPNCRTVGIVDEDQARGRVSIQCPTPGCGFHETRKLEEVPV